MRTGRLGNPQVRMIPKMCLKNIQITSDCRSWARLKSEVEEGFLHSGAAKTAVSPVGMTGFGKWTTEKRDCGEVPAGRSEDRRLHKRDQCAFSFVLWLQQSPGGIGLPWGHVVGWPRKEQMRWSSSGLMMCSNLQAWVWAS